MFSHVRTSLSISCGRLGKFGIYSQQVWIRQNLEIFSNNKTDKVQRFFFFLLLLLFYFYDCNSVMTGGRFSFLKGFWSGERNLFIGCRFTGQVERVYTLSFLVPRVTLLPGCPLSGCPQQRDYLLRGSRGVFNIL